MKLYLVVGENFMPNSPSWGICGIFKKPSHAWSCSIPEFSHKRVIEIETDFIENEQFLFDEKEKQPKSQNPPKKPMRMIQI